MSGGVQEVLAKWMNTGSGVKPAVKALAMSARLLCDLGQVA